MKAPLRTLTLLLALAGTAVSSHAAEPVHPDAVPTTAHRDPVPALNTKDGLALHGYDPVAYFTRGAPTPGDPRYVFTWHGATWRFASEEDRALFEADPARYAPQYGGYCAYAISVGKIADIDPARWDVVDGRLFLNNSLLSRGLWSVGREERIRSGDANWEALPKR